MAKDELWQVHGFGKNRTILYTKLKRRCKYKYCTNQTPIQLTDRDLLEIKILKPGQTTYVPPPQGKDLPYWHGGRIFKAVGCGFLILVMATISFVMWTFRARPARH